MALARWSIEIAVFVTFASEFEIVTSLPEVFTSEPETPVSVFATLTSATNNQITSLQQQIQLVTDQANLQANTLRAQFTASETLIAQLQSVQSSLGQLTGSTSSR